MSEYEIKNHGDYRGWVVSEKLEGQCWSDVADFPSKELAEEWVKNKEGGEG